MKYDDGDFSHDVLLISRFDHNICINTCSHAHTRIYIYMYISGTSHIFVALEP